MYLSKVIPVLALCLLFVACELPTTPNTNSKSNTNANTPTPPPSPALKITQPAEGDKVEQVEVVKGTSQNIPKDQDIWVVVFVQKVNRYYPQNNPVDIQANGNWASSTSFGIPKDKGLKFDALAVTVNKDARAAFDEYLKRARDKNDYPGWEQLPKGTTTYDRLTVIRK